MSETFTLTDNFALAPSSAGTTISSVTNAALSFSSSNQTSSLSLFGGTDLVYRKDPGGGSSTSGFNPNVSANYSVRGQTTTFSLGANYSDAPINFQTTAPGVIIPPGGSSTIPLITSTANQINYGANVNLSRQINAANSLNGGLSYSGTDFDASATTLFDYNTSTASLSWSHDFNSSLTGSIDGSYSVFSTDDPATNLEARTTSLGVSATWQRTNNITLNGGLDLAHTSQDTTAGSSSSTDVNGSFGIDYALPTGNLSASVSRSLSPGSGGTLLQSTSFGVSGTYDINNTSRLGLDVGYTEDGSLFGGASTSILTISPTYAIDLTSSVTARASYTLRNSDSGAGSATSHGISVKLTKKFDLLP